MLSKKRNRRYISMVSTNRMFKKHSIKKTKQRSNILTKKKSLKGGDLTEKLKNLEHRLEIQGFTMIDVPDDGNCFLHAILKTIGSDETAQELRASLVKIIDDNKDKLVSPPEDPGENFKWSEIPYRNG